ncbi:hypothetical protein Tco_0526565 [Tanacetum coccineum]
MGGTKDEDVKGERHRKKKERTGERRIYGTKERKMGKEGERMKEGIDGSGAEDQTRKEERRTERNPNERCRRDEKEEKILGIMERSENRLRDRKKKKSSGKEKK